MGGHKTTTDPGPDVLQWTGWATMRPLLHDKGLLHKDLFDDVNWAAVGEAMESFLQLFRMWATKHVSGWCGVGKRMFQWEKWETDCCPCCGAENETTAHVVLCPDARMREAWRDQLLGLEVWLSLSDTHPQIQACLILILANQTFQYTLPADADPLLRQALELQTSVGWTNLVEGKLVTHWQRLQEQHYYSTSSRRTARTWASLLVIHLLEAMHMMWTTRNGILHERDECGAKLEAARRQETTIREEFKEGTAALHPCDHHYFERGLEGVLQMDFVRRQAWLDGVEAARVSYYENRNAELEAMQQLLHNWLHRSG